MPASELCVGDKVRSPTGRPMTVMRVVHEGVIEPNGEALMPGVWVCFTIDGRPHVGVYEAQLLETISTDREKGPSRSFGTD